MKWNVCGESLPPVKNYYTPSEDVLLWFPERSEFDAGNWYVADNEWICAESMGGFHIQPTLWCWPPANPTESPELWKECSVIVPTDTKQKLCWRDTYTGLVVLRFKKNSWYEHLSHEYPLPDHALPTHWMDLEIPT